MRKFARTSGFALWALLQTIAVNDTPHSFQLSGVMDSLQGINDIFIGINAFIVKISAFTSFIGISTVLLFLAVLILSAGFSVIGVPRGKGSFLLSLLVADAIWFAWELSFQPGQYGFVPLLLKSNALILVPLLVVSVTAYIFPKAGAAMGRLVRPLMGHKKPAYTKSEMLELFEEYQLARSELERSLLLDISRAGNEWITLSSGTLRSATLLQKTMKRLSASSKESGDDIKSQH